MDQQLLMSLLAARNGGALPTGPDGAIDPAALDPNAMLQRMGQDNPTVAAILQMMEAQKAAAAAREPAVYEGSVVDVTAQEIEEITAQLEAALTEVKLLRERCDTLAAALGACGLCWGQDLGCRACRGQGAPGRSIPDEQLFCDFVVPAVRLMHASRQRSNNVAPRADSTPMHLTS
jgi:hypothetical protein